jgi:predicted nucleotidyltransferase
MERIPEVVERLARRYGLRDVYVFGSRAAEIAARVWKPAASASDGVPSSSDVDIAIEPLRERTLSARDRVRLADDLERLFGAPRVDLVILSQATPFLAFEIVSGELLYTADALAQAEHELYVLRRAADLAPFQRERVADILGSGAR